MISTFAMSLALLAAMGSQIIPPPAPAAADSQNYERDVHCLAAFTIARGILRTGDPRQDQIEAVAPALRTRLQGYVDRGVRDEGQFALDLQEATNDIRLRFEPEIRPCLDREAAQP